MPKFKVGDKVRIKTSGDVRTIVDIEDHFYCYTFETGGAWEDDGLELVEEAPSKVKNPQHYGQGSIECIEYIKDFLSEEEWVGYLRGNITKYLHRWPHKNGLEDLEKARVYLDWLIETQKES